MAERSMLWTTNGTGHGVVSGYATDRWQSLIRKLFMSDQAANACVLNGVDNELAVSGTASPLAVNTGAGIANTFFYENDASLNLTVATPGVGTTGGHVILEANWAAQTVTAKAIKSADGVIGIPALTQILNTTWQVRLATFTITVGGVITLTDVRKRCKFSNHVYANGFDVSAVDGATIELGAGALRLKDAGTTRAKLANAVALSVIGRSANSAGVPADIAATPASGAVLRESGSTIGWGTVATAGIANSAIDDTKAGNRVLQFYRRQGAASTTDWSLSGTTNHTPTEVRSQAGCRLITIANGASIGSANITFPQAFLAGTVPLILISLVSGALGGDPTIKIDGVGVDNATAQINAYRTGITGVDTVEVNWLAIGAE